MRAKKTSIDLTTIGPLKTLVDVDEDTNSQLSTVDRITKQIRINEPFGKERVYRNSTSFRLEHRTPTEYTVYFMPIHRL